MTGLRWLLAGLLMVGLASTPHEGLAQATPTVDLWQSTIADLGCKPEYEFDTLSTDDIWLLASAFGGCRNQASFRPKQMQGRGGDRIC